MRIERERRVDRSEGNSHCKQKESSRRHAVQRAATQDESAEAEPHDKVYDRPYRKEWHVEVKAIGRMRLRSCPGVNVGQNDGERDQRKHQQWQSAYAGEERGPQ